MKVVLSYFFRICFAVVFLTGGSVRIIAQGTGGDGTAPLVSPSALSAVASTAKAAAATSAPGTLPAGNADLADFPGKTVMDEPGYTDSRLIVPVDERGKEFVTRLSKIDLDADLNYDGTFDNTSSSGQTIHEFVPPGLEIGVGELTRFLIRFKTYEQEFPGKLVVRLEVAGINRDAVSGAFEKDAGQSVGRIRVWRDQARKELLLDSDDTSRLHFEWTYDREDFSGGIPRTVYVEGVRVSPKFDGDLRLLVVSSHVDESSASVPLYSKAFDHVLVTVRDKPVEKEFINNNVENVWSMVTAPGGPEDKEGNADPGAAETPRE
jgi:hypothetical protein